MTRHVLLLDLREDPELIAAYEAWHAPGKVPEAVVRSIRSSGITGMEIFRTGHRLVMVMEVNDSFDPAKKRRADEADPDVTAWEALMERFQQRLPWAAPDQKWVPAQRIFDLQEQG